MLARACCSFEVLFLALFGQLTCSVVAGKQRYTKKGTRGRRRKTLKKSPQQFQQRVL
jgi:hypothetical protein